MKFCLNTLQNIVLKCTEVRTAENYDLWIFLSRYSVPVLQAEMPVRMETLSWDEWWRTISVLVNVVKGGLAGRQLNGSSGTRRY